MVQISIVLLIAVVVFLVLCGATIVARVYDERNALKLAGKLMLQQRDEARREVCGFICRISGARDRHSTPEKVATERGWSYLYETEDK